MPHPTVPAVVRDPENAGNMVALDVRVDYAPEDPLVAAYPWAFAALDTAVRESVTVEAATAAPGEKRTRRK